MSPLFLLALLSLTAGRIAADFAPGKVAIWTNSGDSNSQRPIVYNTKTTLLPELSRVVDTASQDFDVVVYLKSKQDDIDLLKVEPVKNSIENSLAVTVFSSIYGGSTSNNAVLAGFNDAIGGTTIFRSAVELSVAEMKQRLLNQNSQDVGQALNSAFVVTVESDDIVSGGALEELLSLQPKHDKKVLFLAHQQPVTVSANIPPAGNYENVISTGAVTAIKRNRALAGGDATKEDDEEVPVCTEELKNTFGSKCYLPEGSEFSIYYADTYLYVTPDIFTGIMTALFCAFVAAVGLSCMSGIQGMSSFYDRIPSVGKEA